MLHALPPSGMTSQAFPVPRYPRNSTFLKPEEREEFGFDTVHELVQALNSAWARVGRRPLANGSFPTSRIRMRFVLTEMRLARLEGLLDQPLEG